MITSEDILEGLAENEDQLFTDQLTSIVPTEASQVLDDLVKSQKLEKKAMADFMYYQLTDLQSSQTEDWFLSLLETMEIDAFQYI